MIRYESAQEFLDANRAALLEREPEYNLILGLAGRIVADPSLGSEAIFLGLPDGGQALRTGPHRPLVVSHLSAEAITSLVRELDASLVGVVGPRETAAAFAEEWPAKARLHMGQLIYEARSITLPPEDGGSMIDADESELDRVLRWAQAFAEDAGTDEAGDPERIRQMATRALPGLVFWKTADGRIVSMAGSTRGTPNGATIAYVYTPPDLRCRGFASQVVGHLSRRILDGGKSFCSLYTDAANPTSNSIYSKLGYEIVGESAHYLFDA